MEKGRKENTCVSESKKTKGEDEERRRREKTFLPELGFFLSPLLDSASWFVGMFYFCAFLHYGNRFVVSFSKVVVVGFLVKELRIFFGFRRHSQVTYCLKTNLTSILYK